MFSSRCTTAHISAEIVKHESLHNAVYIQSGILQSSHNTQEDKSVAVYPTILQLMPRFPSIANFHDAVVRCRTLVFTEYRQP